MGLVLPLRALHVPQPGQIAVRLLSAAAAAWVVLQIGALAGRRRLAGAAFALVVVAGAGFLFMAGTGETVLPGAGAALLALVLASRPGASLAAAAGSLALALVLRQDNLLIVPGVALGLAAAAPEGTRFGRVAKVLAASALVTLAAYVAAWYAATGAEQPFVEWIIWLARGGSWARKPFEWTSLAEYAGTLPYAFTGPFWSPSPRPWIGAGIVAAIVAAGLALRGSLPRRALVLPAVVTLALWAGFYAWWYPSNYEYLIPSVVVLAATMAGLANGEAAASPAVRAAGATVLLGLAAWSVVASAPNIARLRERRLAQAVESSAEAGRGAHHVAVGGRAQVVLAIHGVPHAVINDNAALDRIISAIEEEVRKTPGRTLVVSDRYSFELGPASGGGPALPFDSIEDRPGVRFLRYGGLVYAVLFDPVAAESR
jgi:hypothetical protein